MNPGAICTTPPYFREKLLTQMTDPSDALNSFQHALLNGRIELQRGSIDPELFVHVDHPNGKPRFAYVRLQGQTVVVLVMFVLSEPIDKTPCFQIGYAVPKEYRNEGRAKSAICAAITELKQGLARNKISKFYVEAVVGTDNEVSKHVAALTISNAPVEITDSVSGLPALHYVRKVAKETDE